MELNTKIGLEIHVQLATKSKMFCRCDNNAEGKKPNSVVCPICLGMPGTLPVTNKQAVEYTFRAGLALNCRINKIAKFDRKHYFYPDLPKGYQISQYDEPFCSEGYLEIEGEKIRLNRIHLEEDAGKLIHSNGKSLVDLNRAGTPLMEIVTEPDIKSPEQAGAFLRKLQRVVRDEAGVSEASMEKGHMRCDANISVNDGDKMSEIVELKNINSFRFIEKALAIEDARLREEYPNWSEKKKKVTRGYDSKKNETYPQRQKEEAADYRYFPEPDLPPFDSDDFDLNKLKSQINKSHEDRIESYLAQGVNREDAVVLAADSKKENLYNAISLKIESGNKSLLAKALVQNYFNFSFDENDIKKSSEYALAINDLASKKINKQNFVEIVNKIHEGKKYQEIMEQFIGEAEKLDLSAIVENIITKNTNEVESYKAGKTQLLGYFMGQVMKETSGKADPKIVSELLKEQLKK